MPATFPCPNIPKQPSKIRDRRPSRSTNCLVRKMTIACATVSRFVIAVAELRITPASLILGPELLAHKGQPGIDAIPGRTDPGVLGVVRDGQGTRRACQKIQVVHVVSRTRHNGVVATVHEDYGSVSRLHDAFDRF